MYSIQLKSYGRTVFVTSAMNQREARREARRWCSTRGLTATICRSTDYWQVNYVWLGGRLRCD